MGGPCAAVSRGPIDARPRYLRGRSIGRRGPRVAKWYGAPCTTPRVDGATANRRLQRERIANLTVSMTWEATVLCSLPGWHVRARRGLGCVYTRLRTRWLAIGKRNGR